MIKTKPFPIVKTNKPMARKHAVYVDLYTNEIVIGYFSFRPRPDEQKRPVSGNRYVRIGYFSYCKFYTLEFEANNVIRQDKGQKKITVYRLTANEIEIRELFIAEKVAARLLNKP